MRGPITACPVGKHAAPQSAADSADVLPMETAHTQTHLEEEKIGNVIGIHA